MGQRQRPLEGVVMNRTFWQGKRVFLTGHTGFKGSWLSLLLQHLGAQVTGYALTPNTTPNLFEIARVADNQESVIGDIRDLETLSATMGRARPEVVIHMAAQPLVRDSYDDPVGTYATNVMGTVHLLEAARQTDSVRVILNITSDKCYENQEWLWGYRENEPMGGHDPYSSSKGCAELVSSAYRRSFFQATGRTGPALATARAGNVIGGGDWAKDRLIPDMIRAYGEGRPLVLRNPSAVRPWQHTIEPLAGYLLLCEKLWHQPDAHAEAWNFGPSHEDTRSVASVIESLAKHMQDGPGWVNDDHQQSHEAQLLKLDCSKAMERLGWRPRWRLDTAIEATAAWYQAHRQGGTDMRDFTIQQIERYWNECAG